MGRVGLAGRARHREVPRTRSRSEPCRARLQSCSVSTSANGAHPGVSGTWLERSARDVHCLQAATFSSTIGNQVSIRCEWREAKADKR